MAQSSPKITDLVSLTTLQTVQEHFAALGRMSVCIATVEGELITTPTWGSPFSGLLGTSPRGRRALIEGIRSGYKNPRPAKPVSCHEGMQLYTTPILHDGRTLAVLAVGTRKHQAPPADDLQRIAREYGLPLEDLTVAAEMLDPRRGGTREAINRFADVLARMIATLYGQAEHIGRQLNELRTVHEFSDLLSSTMDLQEILNRTVKRVVEVMPIKACAIRLLNPDTGELVIKAVHNLSEEYLRKSPVLLQNSPIDGAAFAGHSVYIADAPNDPRMRYPENARREGIVSSLCVPLAYRGQTIGVIRVYTGQHHVFSEAEESLLRSIGSQAAAAIIHSRLFAEQADAERVQRQVDAAAQIQRRMLPARPPKVAGVSIGALYDPSLQVGGDFYDFLELPGGRTGVCIADVVGKGLPAALLMASMRSTLRAFAPAASNPATAVSQLNAQMTSDASVREFATLAYLVLSADGRAITCCNGGHLPPLLLRGEKFVELGAGGMAVGVRAGEPFENETVAFRPGDLLVMVTDGVTEAMDFQGELFRADRLRTSIYRHRNLDAQQLAGQLLWDVRRFVGLAEQSDDITIVVIRAE